jgi:hypothetical protein
MQEGLDSAAAGVGSAHDESARLVSDVAFVDDAEARRPLAMLSDRHPAAGVGWWCELVDGHESALVTNYVNSNPLWYYYVL